MAAPPSTSTEIHMKKHADPATPLLPAGHHVRITQTGKMKGFISHAESWLKLNPDVPLVFHTLPPSHLPPKPVPTLTAPRNEPEFVKPDQPQRSSSSSSRPPSTITIPKLISVMELVKREYQASFSARELEDGRGRMWQYNTSGVLSEVGRTRETSQADIPAIAAELDTGAGVDHELVSMLQAGGNIRMSHSPYMVVILSLRPLTHLQAQRNMTYQAILPPRPRAKSKRGKPKTNESEEDKVHRLYVARQARKAAGMPRVGRKSGDGEGSVAREEARNRQGDGVEVEDGDGDDEEMDDVEEPEEPEVEE